MTQPSETDTKPVNGAAPVVTSTAIVPASQEQIAPFASQEALSTAARMARALAASTLVPQQYRDNIPNCMIALELAQRIGASVFMVMQNLDVIHGTPGWRAKFLVATVNASGRFTPIRWRFEGKPNSDEWGCRAYAKDKADGEECVGPLVNMAMAKAEKWSTKDGSKWRTMPELMLMYRSAAFWTRLFAPELSLGIQTAEEVEDVQFLAAPLPVGMTPGPARDLEAELAKVPDAAPSEPKAEARQPGEEG
jgi:hypothetical protein